MERDFKKRKLNELLQLIQWRLKEKATDGSVLLQPVFFFFCFLQTLKSVQQLCWNNMATAISVNGDHFPRPISRFFADLMRVSSPCLLIGVEEYMEETKQRQF